MGCPELAVRGTYTLCVVDRVEATSAYPVNALRHARIFQN